MIELKNPQPYNAIRYVVYINSVSRGKRIIIGESGISGARAIARKYAEDDDVTDCMVKTYSAKTGAFLYDFGMGALFMRYVRSHTNNRGMTILAKTRVRL